MILSCSNISKSFGENDILKHVSFHIEEHEKAAVVGINGAGKSTLLKIIIGELAADEGLVTLSKGASIGYLAQHQDLAGAETIYDALLEVKRPILAMEERIRRLEADMKSAAGEDLEAMLQEYSRLNHEFEMAEGYSIQSEITGVLKGLGFGEEEFGKSIDALSGGQKTRVSLGKLLLTRPDVLLLDEPTNHLDMDSIAWLEGYLKTYPGSVLIVAHDRYFLDRVATKIIELDGGIATVFSGDYTAYSEKKAQLREARLRAYLNQQQEIRHQEEVIAKLRSFNREKSIRRAESREKMLEKMDRLEKPQEVNDAMDIRLEPDVVSGNDVLTIRDLAKSFGSQQLFSHVDIDIKRGERVAVIGNNGTGKTTLLKIIDGLLPADCGEIRLGSKVHIGYYDQEQFPPSGRAHQPPGHHLQGDPGGRPAALHRNRSLRVPRPVFYQSHRHPDSGPEGPVLLKLYRELRLLSGEKGGRGSRRPGSQRGPRQDRRRLRGKGRGCGRQWGGRLCGWQGGGKWRSGRRLSCKGRSGRRGRLIRCLRAGPRHFLRSGLEAAEGGAGPHPQAEKRFKENRGCHPPAGDPGRGD